MPGQLSHERKGGRIGKRSALAVAMAVAMLFPVAAWAADQFSDVPTGHTFHDEIGAVADAGITIGYGDGTFRPDDEVSRQAMAAFFARGASSATTDSVGFNDSVSIDDSDGTVDVIELDVEVPGEPGGQQLVHLSATSQMFTNSTKANACTGGICNIYLDIHDADDNEIGEGGFVRLSGDFAGSTLTITGLDMAPTGTTQTYTVVAKTFNVQSTSAIVRETSIDAVTIPMDAGSS